MSFTVSTTSGDYDLTAEVILAGDDIQVTIWGGDKPHIGAVAAAQPRPSLDDPDKTSASTSVICFTGHKEDELVKFIAENLASAFNVRVVVCAGAHWDEIGSDGISCVRRNAAVLADLLTDEIRRWRRSG